MKRKLTCYTVPAKGIERTLRLAVASDIHGAPVDDVLEEFSRCDAVLVPGDLVDRHRRNNDEAVRFLQAVPDVAPVFYSLGNHEWLMKDAASFYRRAAETRATLLMNESCLFHGVRIGGLVSSEHPPDEAFLDRFEQEEGFRLLMCHHPDVFPRYVSGRNIDLTLSGHAHGGQIQIGGQGLYAPGQGLLPRLTDGFYFGDRLLVSRGMTNSTKRMRIPRINNPCELILLTLERKG